MKMLKDGSTGFYISKWNYLYLLIFPVVMSFFLFMSTAGFRRIPMNHPIFYVILLLIGLPLLVFIYKIFIDKTPHIKMTRDNLETRNMVPILWNDITSAHIERRRVGKHGIHDFICFEVRDLSVYKLKWWQKIQKKSGKTPFAVDLDLMPKKERELFEQTIRARIEIADKRPQK